ncbi:MAG: hypothetical protein ACTSV2_09775 [Candidatus Thorarchaeota archaeon]
MMNVISDILRWIFAYILYPGVIITIFIYIIITIGDMIDNAKGSSKYRRLTGAMLPLVALIFLVVSEGIGDNSQNFLSSLSSSSRFAVGGLVCVAVFEFGRYFMKNDSEIGSALYAMFLSMIGTFILYSFMIKSINTIHPFLLGIIIIGGLHIVFRGPTKLS